MKILLLICVLVTFLNTNAQPVIRHFSSYGAISTSVKQDEISAALCGGFGWKYYSLELNLIPLTFIKNDPYNGNKVNISATIGLNFLSALLAEISTGGRASNADSGIGRILFFAFTSPILLNSEHHLNILQSQSDSLKVFNLSLFGRTQFDPYGFIYNKNMWARFSLSTGVQFYYSFSDNPSILSFALQAGISKSWDITPGAKLYSVSPYVAIKMFGI